MGFRVVVWVNFNHFCIFIDQKDQIFICDFKNHRIQVFDCVGNFIYTFGRYGTGAGEF